MTACRSRTGANINILTKGFLLQHTHTHKHTHCTRFGASGRSGCATQLGDFICSRLNAPHFSGAELGLVQPQSPAPLPYTLLRASMLHTHLKRFQWQFQISAALPDIAATFSNAYLTSLCVVIVNQHCCTPIRLSVSPLGPPPSPSPILLCCNCVFNCAGFTLLVSNSLGFCSSTKLPLPLSIVIFVLLLPASVSVFVSFSVSFLVSLSVCLLQG